MIGIQIIAITFSVIMMYFSYFHYRRNEFRLSELFFWQILWVGLIAVTLFPNSFNFITDTFKFSRTFDLVVIVGIVVVFAVTFRNFVIVRRLERKVEDFTRQESIAKLKKEN